MSDRNVLDENLAALVGRVYVPVVLRPEYRAGLEAEFLARIATLPGEDVGSVPLRWTRVAALVVAAAALVLAVLWIAPDSSTREEILGRGNVAWRSLLREKWREQAPAVELPLSRLPIEIETPARAGVALERGTQHAALDPDSFARVWEGHDSDDVDFFLERGGITIEWRAETAVPNEARWRIVADSGRVLLEHGLLTARVVGDALEVELVSGSARVFLGSGESFALDVGERGRLADGRFVRDVPGEESAELAELQDPASPSVRNVVDAEVEMKPGVPELERDPLTATVVLAITGSDGAPLAAADTVRVATLLITDLPNYETSGIARPKLRPDGTFALGGVAPGRYWIDVEEPEHALWRGGPYTLEPGAEKTITVALEGSRTVSGVVVDPAGEPVTGAWVVSEHEMPQQPIAMVREQLSPLLAGIAETDDAGRFSLELSSGEHILRASHGDHAAGWSETLTISAGITIDDVRIALTRGGRIHGRVEREDGSPWEGVDLIASHVEYGRMQQQMSYSATTTDAFGEYAVSGLPPGHYAVFIPGVDNLEMKFLDLRPGGDVEVDFTRSFTGARVFGRLTTPGGAPVARTGVSLNLKGATSRQQDDHHFSYSDEDGRYEFREIPPGDYEFFVTPDQGMTVLKVGWIEVPDWVAVERDLEIPAASIEGRVWDGVLGVPMARAVVVLLAITGPEDSGEFVGRIFTDQEGRFRFPHVQRDHYRVVAIAQSAVRGFETVEDVLPRQDDEPLELVLFEGAVVLTTVVDEAGNPIAGAGVSFTDEVGLVIPFSELELTDARGAHVANGVRPGAWRLRVAAEGYAPQERLLDVTEGTLEVKFELSR